MTSCITKGSDFHYPSCLLFLVSFSTPAFFALVPLSVLSENETHALLCYLGAIGLSYKWINTFVSEHFPPSRPQKSKSGQFRQHSLHVSQKKKGNVINMLPRETSEAGNTLLRVTRLCSFCFQNPTLIPTPSRSPQLIQNPTE